MLDLPSAPPFRLARARVPAGTFELAADSPPPDADADGAALLDLDIDADGRILRASAAKSSPPSAGVASYDLRGRHVWPGLVEAHAHIDKSHTWRRAPNPNGTLRGARDAVKGDRAPQWPLADVMARMEFALRCAYAHGATALRTHIDSQEGRTEPSWTAIAELRRKWRGRLILQPVATLGLTKLVGDWGDRIARLAAEQGAVLGPVVYDGPGVIPDLARAFELATRYRLDLDLHVDETGDPSADALTKIAEMALETGFAGRILCSHACSLAKRSESEVVHTVARVREAGIGIVSLPMTNIYLQDRVLGRTPRWRGITLVRELRAAGVPVALGGDNVRDAFHCFGDHDMIDVFRDAVRLGHLDLPIGDWPTAVTATAASMLGIDGIARIAAGFPADLVIFPARDYSELIARHGGGRHVLRQGRMASAAIPDYEELDALLRPRGGDDI